MGSILNPVDNNSFVELVAFKNEDIFVDKTDFIPKISAKINANKRLFAVIRPRRFGKTVTAHMLLASPQIRKNRHSSYAPCVLLKSLCRTKYF